MHTATLCSHAWQLEGLAAGTDPLAWWWCTGGCGSTAVGAPQFTTTEPGLLIPVLFAA